MYIFVVAKPGSGVPPCASQKLTALLRTNDHPIMTYAYDPPLPLERNDSGVVTHPETVKDIDDSRDSSHDSDPPTRDHPKMINAISSLLHVAACTPL